MLDYLRLFSLLLLTVEMSSSSTTCERCGFNAPNVKSLITHLKNEIMCPSRLSKVTHTELINKLKPPLSTAELTCTFCNALQQTIGSKTSHMKYYCHANPNRVSTNSKKSKDAVHVPKNVSVEANRKYLKNIYSNNKLLHPFTKDVSWKDTDISSQSLCEFALNQAQGVVDCFIELHTHEAHKNVEWNGDKLIAFDGKGWTEVDHNMLTSHLGFLYSAIEEAWCDYEMDLRCETSIPMVVEEDHEHVNNFLYNIIVDDDSVMYHCNDILFEYLETLKTC
jgi:hypothetical protein